MSTITAQGLSPSHRPYEANTVVVTLRQIPVHPVPECNITDFPTGMPVSIVIVGDNLSTPPGKERTAPEIPVSERKYKVKGVMTVEKQVLGTQFTGVPHKCLFPNTTGTTGSFVGTSGAIGSGGLAGTIIKVKEKFDMTVGHETLTLKKGEEVMIIEGPLTQSGKDPKKFTPVALTFYSVRKVRRKVETETFRSRVWVAHDCLALMPQV